MNAPDVDDCAHDDDEVQRLRDELERDLWELLNDPAMQRVRNPHAVAGALAGVLLKVLSVMAATHPESDVRFGLQLLAQVEAAFVRRSETAIRTH
jgi:hypothetical protein